MSEPVQPVFQPLFAHEQPGPRLKVHQAARLMAEPGLTAESLATQFRGFAQRRLIQPRSIKGSGPTAHNEYALADVAVAKVLSVLTTDDRRADAGVMQAAANGCYAWTANARLGTMGHAHPISAALEGTERGEWWVFQLDALRSDQTGELVWRAYVYDSETGPTYRAEFPPEFQPRTATTIHLRPLFLPLVCDHSAGN